MAKYLFGGETDENSNREIFSEELYNVIQSLVEEGKVDEAIGILWKVKSTTDRMSTIYKNLSGDLIGICNKLDNEPVNTTYLLILSLVLC